MFEVGICDIHGQLTPNTLACSSANICQQQFNITLIKTEPYDPHILAELLSRCCGVNCTQVKLVKTLTRVSEITDEVMDTSHFVFPVLARTAARKIHGYRFIPVIDTPTLYYIAETDASVTMRLSNTCLEMWPLMAMLLLMLGVAGFCGWFLETWSNEVEFPRSFLIGWFEGFWWSFILLTTVGYGDKVTKSFLGKLLSVVWVLVGITTFSMLTAELTSVISALGATPSSGILGHDVGALRYRTYDAALIAQEGAVLIDVEHSSLVDGVTRLISMVQKNEIDGFVLDKNTFLRYLYHSYHAGHHEEKIQYLKDNCHYAEKSYEGEKLSYGALVNNEELYEYLSEFVVDNLPVINTCIMVHINEYSRKDNITHQKINRIFSSSGNYFLSPFYALTLTTAVICIFGVAYELRRNRVMDTTELKKPLHSNPAEASNDRSSV